MANDSDNMRKYLNVLAEDGPLAPGAFVDPMAAVDPAMDDPMDDVPTSGPETKIEVTMKDGDEVEVEVYAQQGAELNRLMDLAGMFHKDKQSGMLDSGAAAPDMTPDADMAPIDIVPDMDSMAPDTTMSPTDDDYEMNYGDEMSDIPPEGGPDVPVGADMDDIALDMDDAPEMDFDISDDPMYEDDTKRNDFGYPNPMAGQEEYELKAFDFSGSASKPVRFVPARSGDNPMIDMSNKKSLMTYMKEIDDSKKKVLNELANDEKADDTVADLASGVKVKDTTLDKLQKVAKDVQQGASPGDTDAELADDALDAAEAQGVQLNPNVKTGLKKNVADMQKDDAMKESDFKLPVIDEDELEERKRRYSFSPEEFGRGIVTTPASKRKKAARRGLSIYKK